MPGFTKICEDCGYEILKIGQTTTWYKGKKICECDEREDD